MKTRKQNGSAAPDEANAFAQAIRRALAQADGEATRLDRVAETLVRLAIDGNMQAIKEISERIDGRSGTLRGQGSTSDGEPVEVSVKWLKD